MFRSLHLSLVLLLTITAAVAEPSPEEIKKVAADMVCLCGDCNRQSLATCVCSSFAVPERERIGDMMEAGKTPEEIVARYIDEFGVHILAAPPARGYSVIAWIGPFLGLVVGFLVVRFILRRWRDHHAGSTLPALAPDARPAGSDQSTFERQRLARELEEFDAES